MASTSYDVTMIMTNATAVTSSNNSNTMAASAVVNDLSIIWALLCIMQIKAITNCTHCFYVVTKLTFGCLIVIKLI